MLQYRELPGNYAIDVDLWHAFKNGDHQAYLKIYDDNYRALFNYGCRINSDTSLTNGCIQDIFLKLSKGRRKVNHGSSIRAYLLKILKVRMQAQIKRQQKDSGPDEFAIFIPGSFGAQLIDNEVSKEICQLEHAIAELTGRQKEILHLKFYQGLGYEEIAQVTNLKIGRVYKLIYEAIKKIRRQWSSFAPMT